MSLRPNARVEVRKKGYKLAVDADEARRKREDNMVEIRKNKRDESLLKKRREGMQPQQFASTAQTAAMEKKVLSFFFFEIHANRVSRSSSLPIGRCHRQL